MSHSPSTTWGERLLTGLAQRTAMAVVAGVTFAAVAPSLANAAGAHVPDPVAIALRSGRKAITAALDPAKACPSDDATDDGTGETGDTGVTGPTGDTGVTGPTGPAGVETEAPDCDDEGAEPEESEDADEEADEKAEEAAGKGKIVSTVAHCAPHGKDPLLSAEGALQRNHGAFVKAAAHGDTLTTSFGSFDLSTQAGADSLCAAVASARAALPAAAPDAKGKDAKGEKADTAKNDKKAQRDKASKPASADADDEADSDADDEDAEAEG